MGDVPLARENATLPTGRKAARRGSGDMGGHIVLLGLSGEGLLICL